MDRKKYRKYFLSAAIAMFSVLFVVTPSVSCMGRTDYILDENGGQIPIPLTHDVTAVVANVDGITFKNPQDIFIDKNDVVFVADTGNNRIVAVGGSGKLQGVYDCAGSLNAPEGVYVSDDGDIFIADTGNKRIVHLGKSGDFIEEFTKPESELLDETMDFSVTKIYVDAQGNLITIKGQALMKIDPKSEFKGYVGSNKLGFSLTQTLIRLFASDEQKAKLAKTEPPSYTNFVIGRDGLIYTVSAKQSGQIRVINSVGNNIYPEQFYGENIINAKGYYDTPDFVDISVDADGIISVLEQQYGKIYQYDNEGNLLAVFGGKGNIKGMFGLPVSIATDSAGCVYVLDAAKNCYHVFKPTEFTQNIKAAVKLYADGKYDDGYQKWQEVLATDVNYPQANNGIAKMLYKQNNQTVAMQYYKAAKDRGGYSNAFSEWRYTVFRKNFGWVLLAAAATIFVLGFLVIKVKKYATAVVTSYYVGNRHNLNSVKLGVLSLFHPMDFFDIVKRERKQQHYLSSFVLIAILAFVNYLSIFITHFPLNPKETSQANFFLELAFAVIPVVTWVVSSYAVSSILSGESKFGERMTASCYCLIPYLVIVPVLSAVSNILCANEAGIFNFIKAAVVFWCVLMMLVSFQRMNDFSFWKTVGVTLLSVLMMAVIWAVLLLAFSLTVQFIYTIRDIIREINLKLFL